MNNEEVENFKIELDEFCKKYIDSKLVYFDERTLSNVSFSETYRSLVNYHFSNKALRDLLISSLEQINKFSPVTVSFIPFFIRLKNISKIAVPSEESISKAAIEPNKKSIEEIIRFCFKDSSLMQENDFIKIFEKNGFISYFNVEKSNSFHNACIFLDGYNVSSKIPQIFFDAIKKDRKDLYDSHIVLYDGYIESVSEVNSLLSDSYEQRSSYVIFCRGSHPDVERTCAVNLGLEKAKVVLAYPEDSFWHDSNLSKLSSKLETEIFGYRTGNLMNSCLQEKSKKIDLVFNNAGITFKGGEFKINKNAVTKIYLNESNWKKKGLVEDQLNYFNSLLQQISLCGMIEKDYLNSLGIDLDYIFKEEIDTFPAFPVMRALKESKEILEKIYSVGLIINR